MLNIAQINVILRITIVILLGSATGGQTQDWTMFGGSPSRNNAPAAQDLPRQWDIGRFERTTGRWREETSVDVRWASRIGSQSYGTPVVANGRVFVGTNNGAGYLKRYPAAVDLGCMLCFRESDGKFLWQYSAEKLPTGRVHDWPQQGICSTPLVEGDRMWFVDNRGCLVCADTDGFEDGKDDGPVSGETGTVFVVVPGVANWLNRSQSYGRRNASRGIAGLFQARGVATAKIRRFIEDVPDRQWTLATIDNPPKKLYRLKVDGYVLQGFKLDDSGKNIEPPLFEIHRDELPALNRGYLLRRARGWFERAGFKLPADVKIKKIVDDHHWTVTAVIDQTPIEFDLKQRGLFMTASKRIGITDRGEADTIWRLDMMKQLGVSQHNMSNCSPAAWGDVLFVCTSNGVDEAHLNAPAPDAPSFIAVDKQTGKILWQDNSPARNILHGQWCSPAIGEFNGVPQVIFCGGDGWVYSFRADRWNQETRTPIPLWKFDANPKSSKWELGGRGSRNNIIAAPVIHDNRIFVAVGQDPEHGEGNGHLWCIDPTKRGDVSPRLAMRMDAGIPVPISHRSIQAITPEKGEFAVDNPNSAVVWHYESCDTNNDGNIDFDEQFHRTISSPVIKDDLLVIPDISGLVHCLDARSGEVYWIGDMLAACWGTPLVVGRDVYIGNEDGGVAIFKLSADPAESIRHIERTRSGKVIKYDEPIRVVEMKSSIYATPIAANNTLFISDRTHLFAIGKRASSK